MEVQLQHRRRASIVSVLQDSMEAIQKEAVSIDWMKVFKASFMLLFVAYPGERRGDHAPWKSCF